MTTIPRPNPRRTDPEGTTRRERGEALLDMVRQWSYSRVTRRANLTRHAEKCSPCRRRAARSEFPPFCTEGRRLAGLAAECDRQLEQLREQLAELDKPEPEPVATSGTLEMF